MSRFLQTSNRLHIFAQQNFELIFATQLFMQFIVDLDYAFYGFTL